MFIACTQPTSLVAHGVFDAQEYRTFRRCEDFLWSVRCNMHFHAGRAEERLSFEMQREIAQRLGYTSHPGLQDVERFMKHYFLILQLATGSAIKSPILPSWIKK